MLEWFRNKRNIRRIGRWCGWAALILLAFTLITGYGISQFRVVSNLTFGLLGKASSHRWHHYTDVPLVLFTLAHVAIAAWFRLTAQKSIRKNRRNK